MGAQQAVRIDFCRAPYPRGPFHDVQRHCDVLRITQPEAIAAAVTPLPTVVALQSPVLLVAIGLAWLGWVAATGVWLG